MTTKDKQTLLQDLLARLPYGVVIKEEYGDYINVNIYNAHIEHLIDRISAGVDKLVLRPMSSMTDMEKQQFNLLSMNRIVSDGFGKDIQMFSLKCIDWLNAHHFDYFGLIEKGLALEAPEGIYKPLVKTSMNSSIYLCVN